MNLVLEYSEDWSHWTAKIEGQLTPQGVGKTQEEALGRLVMATRTTFGIKCVRTERMLSSSWHAGVGY